MKSEIEKKRKRVYTIESEVDDEEFDQLCLQLR